MEEVVDVFSRNDIDNGAVQQWLLSSRSPIDIEIGPGTGHWLVRHASQNPEHRCLAIELNKHHCEAIKRSLGKMGLQNVAIANVEAHWLLKEHIELSSIASVHVYFPTPYPRVLGLPHRLLTSDCADEIFRILRPGGLVRIATDHISYFRQICRSFGRHQWWQMTWYPINDSGELVGTPSERRFGPWNKVQGLFLVK
jgi:tRNA (guanine-N7-)-methyltransferase